MAANDPQSIDFQLNGSPVVVDPGSFHLNLLDFLRARGLTAAKEGCAEGECGACAVALVGEHGSGSAYRVVNSCLMPVVTAAGHEVVTVEGLATNGELAPAQQAMAAAGGSQCGYCTPGFVISLFAEQYRPDREGHCDPHSMAGNLCRCTGYRPIRDAALSLGAPPPGAHLDRLARPAPRLTSITGPSFVRPTSVEDAVAELRAHPQATLIAGGTDLGVDINLKGHEWRHLISLEAITELRIVTESTDGVVIGAGVPLSDLGRRWQGRPAVIDEWLELFASPLIRNRATLGGNIATASPIGDAAPLLLALDARVRIAGPAGRRTVALHEFFTGYRKTALQAGELIVGIEVPAPFPSFVRFYKISKRRFDDISTVAVAMAVDVDDGGTVRRARFGFGGVAATPLRVVAAEEAVENQHWDELAVRRAQQALTAAVSPIGDHRGSRDFRLAVSQRLFDKFWWEWTHERHR